MRAKTESKSTVTRLTNKASDVRPFAKIILPDGKVKIVGNGPNDIDPVSNTVVVYDIDGGGKQKIDLSSGKYYVRDDLEDQPVSNLKETSKKNRLSTKAESLISILNGKGSVLREDEDEDEEDRKDEVDNETDLEDEDDKKSDEDMVDEIDFSKFSDEDIPLEGDDPVDEGDVDLKGDEKYGSADEDDDSEEPNSKRSDYDSKPDDLDASDNIPDEEKQIIRDIQAAIDSLIDYEEKEHAEEEEEEESESKVQERLLRRDLIRFLGEQEAKKAVITNGDTEVPDVPKAKVGQPKNPGEQGGDGEGGSEEVEGNELTVPEEEDEGAPKMVSIGHPEEATPQAIPKDGGLVKGEGPADSDELSGERVSESAIRRDIRMAISLVERGVNPNKLARRVLAGF